MTTGDMTSNPLLLLLVFLSTSSVVFGDDDDSLCYEQPTPCSCWTREGEYIDLKSLSVGNSPRFSYNIGNHAYQWDACRTFDCGGRAASACRKDGPFHSYAIGLQNDAKFLRDDKGNFLQYFGPNEWTKTKVYLKCDPEAFDPQFTAQGGTHGRGEIYEMTLVAKAVCATQFPNGGGGTDENEDYHNPGDIMLLLFVLSMLLFLILGAIFFITRNRRREARVAVQMVP